MPKVQTLTTNFTAGVFSPRLRGRVDIEKYPASMRDASNVVVLKHGGVTARPSLDYKGAIADESHAGRLVPFVYSNTTSYKLEFTEGLVRVWSGGQLTGATMITPYLRHEIEALDFAQAGDTMILFHKDHAPRRIRRFSDTNWAFDTAPISPGPLAELGNRVDEDLVLASAAVGTGVAVAAADPVFLEADVGRTLVYQGGVATITGFTDTENVTVSITTAFPTTTLPGLGWELQGSPMATATPSDAGAEGDTITIGLDIPGWRADDVGKYVEINGGLVRITAIGDTSTETETHNGDDVTQTFAFPFQILAAEDLTVEVGGSPMTYPDDYSISGIGDPAGGTVLFFVPPVTGTNNIELSRSAVDDNAATCTVLREIGSEVAAPPDAWVVKAEAWNETDGYPSTGCFHEQRLFAANTARFPQTVWGSRSGLPFDFLPGPEDDDAVAKTLASRQTTPIRFLHSAKTMIALTQAAEFDIRGGVEKPVTQSNFTSKRQSGWGCQPVKPEEVGDNVLFAQRGGTVVRATYPLDVEGFGARDISIFSEHLLAAGVRGMTFEQSPESVCWIWLQDGGFVALTYCAEQNVIALTPCSTDGVIESMCTVPEDTEDATYAIVARTVNGATRRFVERINWGVNPGMDSRVEATGSGTTWAGFSHLEGESITILADGVAAGEFTVSGGTVTLDSSADAVEGGLPYVPSVTLQDPEVGTGTGTSQGQQISVHRVRVRFLETIGCDVGDESIPWETMGDDPLDGTIAEFTGDKDITDIGWAANGEDPLVLSQPQPYPWTILAVIRELTVNAG